MCAVRRYNNGTSVFQQNMHNLASHCKFVGEVGTARAFKETIRSNFEFMDHIKKTKGECKPVFVVTAPSETGQPDHPEVHLGVLIVWLGSGRKINLVRVRKRCCYGFKYLFWVAANMAGTLTNVENRAHWLISLPACNSTSLPCASSHKKSGHKRLM